MGRITLQTGFRWREEATEKSRAATFADFINGPVLREVSEGDPLQAGIELDFAGVGTIPPIQVSDVPFGVKLYDCLYAKHPIAAAASAATIANQIYAMPFELKKRRRFAEFWFRYNAGGGAKNLRIGLYPFTSDTNRYPGANLLDVSNAGTALGFVTATDLWVEPGWYWQTFLHDVTNAVMAVPVTAMNYIGSGFSTVAGPTMIAGLKIAHAFGALPNPFPAGASLLTAADVFPFIGTAMSE